MRQRGRLSDGTELTNEVLARLAREAEAGLDVGKLRRRPGLSDTSTIVPVVSEAPGRSREDV